MFDLPLVANGLRYYMRLDSDSQVVCNADTPDPFETLAARKAVYGYNSIRVDHPMYVVNMTRFMYEYAADPDAAQDVVGPSERFVPFSDAPEKTPFFCPVQLFYNNFEVVDVRWFSRQVVRRFAARVDASDMIYKHRWGDAPLRFVTLNLFATTAQVFCFGPTMRYSHNGIQNSCSMPPLPATAPWGCNASTAPLWRPEQRERKRGGYGGQLEPPMEFGR